MSRGLVSLALGTLALAAPGAAVSLDGAATGTPLAEPCLEVSGLLPAGSARAVEVAGSLALVAAGSGLVVVDISDPDALAELGRAHVRGFVLSIGAAGGLAAVAAGESGLFVIDLAEPTAPAVVGSQRFPTAAIGVALTGQHALIASGSGGLHVVDVSQPSTPNEVALVATTDARAVAVADDLAVVADGAAGVCVIDVSTPSAPVQLGCVQLLNGHEAIAVALDGSSGLIMGEPEIYLLEIDVPTAPVLTRLDCCLNPAAMAFKEPLACIGEPGWTWGGGGGGYYAPGLVLWDVSDPPVSTYLGAVETFQEPLDIAVAGEHALVGGAWGLVAIDVADPTVPLYSDDLDTEISGTGVAVDGRWALVGVWGGVRVVDVNDPGLPVERAFAETTGERVRAVTVEDGLAVAALDDDGIEVISVADPSDPVTVSSLDIEGDALDVVLHDHLAYVAAHGQGLRVVDLSDPPHPVEIAGLVYPQVSVHGLATGSGLVYLADYSNGLVIVDVTEPGAPTEVSRVATDNRAKDVTVANGIAYLPGDDGVAVVDITDPAAPSLAGSVPIPSESIAVMGDRAYVVDPQRSDVRVLDLADPLSPVEIDQVELYGDGGHEIVESGGRLYVGTWPTGMEIIAPCGIVFADGFEWGSTSAWSITAGAQ